MIGAILFAAALLITFELTRRSVPWGIAAAITVGYFQGVIRANFLNPFTTLMFDAALLALYIGAYLQYPALRGGAWRTPLGKWTTALVLWPALLVLVPVNHLAIQLVAFHASVWFALMLMVGSQLNREDIKSIARWIAVLNVIALGFGLYIYLFGVSALYPQNEITRIAFNSNDVAGGHPRIPSTFLNAHAYGGAMLMSLPFLLSIGFDRSRNRDRLLALVGSIAAVGGILLCAARQPVVVGILAGAITLIVARANVRLLLAFVVAVMVAVLVASQNDRFQRIMTLENTDMVQNRLQGSVNSNFLDLLIEYPMGAGMGSAFGTSIPSFLAQYAPRQTIGLENEYSRIQINQGIIGLALWIGFLIWYFRQIPRDTGKQRPSLAIVFAYGLTTTTWLTAWIGAGTASAIPMAAMMFLLQGAVVNATQKKIVPPPGKTIRSPRVAVRREQPF